MFFRAAIADRRKGGFTTDRRSPTPGMMHENEQRRYGV